MVAPIARPNWIARSTAPRFITGSTPGSARSTGLAWVLGSAPKRIDEPLKILDWVVSCVCVSRPMTTSHCIRNLAVLLVGRLAQVPVGGALVAVRNVEQLRLAEIIADQLQADRTLAIFFALAEAAWYRHAGQA